MFFFFRLHGCRWLKRRRSSYLRRNTSNGASLAMEKLLPNDLGEGPGFLNITEFPIKSDEEWKTLTFRERVKICNEKFLRDNGICPVPAFIATYACIGALWWDEHETFPALQHLTFHPGLRCYLLIVGSTVQAGRGRYWDPFHVARDHLFPRPFPPWSRWFRPCPRVAPFWRCCASWPTPCRCWTSCWSRSHPWCCPWCCWQCVPSLITTSSVPAGENTTVAGWWLTINHGSQVVTICHVLRKVPAIQSDSETDSGWWSVIFLVDQSLCSICFSSGLKNVLRCERQHQWGYFLICMLFPDWINGWQCVQLALWAWAGVGKIGPWFQPVIPFITKDSAYTWLLPKQLMCKLLVKDYPDDLNPSNLSTILAYMGATLEVAFPLCCSTPGRRLSFHGSWEIALGDSLGHIFKNERSNWHVFIICDMLWHFVTLESFLDILWLNDACVWSHDPCSTNNSGVWTAGFVWWYHIKYVSTVSTAWLRSISFVIWVPLAWSPTMPSSEFVCLSHRSSSGTIPAWSSPTSSFANTSLLCLAHQLCWHFCCWCWS